MDGEEKKMLEIVDEVKGLLLYRKYNVSTKTSKTRFREKEAKKYRKICNDGTANSEN